MFYVKKVTVINPYWLLLLLLSFWITGKLKLRMKHLQHNMMCIYDELAVVCWHFGCFPIKTTLIITALISVSYSWLLKDVPCRFPSWNIFIIIACNFLMHLKCLAIVLMTPFSLMLFCGCLVYCCSFVEVILCCIYWW